MLEKTKGIVLQQIKYSDSGIVVWFYTQKFGRQSFILKGLRSKKSGKHNVFCQPMSILDMVIYYKDSRSMQTLKEFSVCYAPSDIYQNVRNVVLLSSLEKCLHQYSVKKVRIAPYLHSWKNRLSILTGALITLRISI